MIYANNLFILHTNCWYNKKQSKEKSIMLNIYYIGHSAFYLKTEKTGILIDPFISGNPKSVFDLQTNKITNIFLTHAHADHLGDAIPISKATRAEITAIFELANYCMGKGALTKGINLGGKIEYPWGSARFLPAFHSSSTPEGIYAGMPASILFEINGLKIYHAGDTCLNSEMKTIGEVYSPDIALLPIGSTFTMDIVEATKAAKWLNAKQVIPMHYNTFDLIKADTDKFKNAIESQDQKCTILKPGESINL